MIWLIGGTTEGKEIAQELLQQGQQVIITVVSEQGKAALSGLPCCVYVGAMDCAAMSAFAIEHNIHLVIDASHPFAQNVSANALLTAGNLGVHFVRYERATERYSGAVYVESYAAAVAYLANAEGNILLATGSRMLPEFAPLQRERIYARVMPTQESIAACEAVQIPLSQILAMNGRMSTELNYQILKEYNIRNLVSKDSGKSGGLPEKVAAAKLAGITLLIIERPQLHYPIVCQNYTQLHNALTLYTK